ncbi:odorant receptor 211 [Tribolium castaneum]|uniref:Odorant receptor n=1 Tax=Tribolium castaneum TaxID=7070 RepID=D6WHK8_TRICA|nr:odorant receptor 211 [Tribolium castaneum]
MTNKLSYAPFTLLRKLIFIESKHCKLARFCDFLLIVLYSLAQCLNMYYMYQHFNLSLVIRYGPVLVFSLLVIVTSVISVAWEKEIFELHMVNRKIFWPLNCVGKNAQTKLTRKCQFINHWISCSLLLFLITVIINFPCFGSQRDFFICVEVFEKYFGEWSFIPYYLYFAASPFLYYHFFSSSFLFVYTILDAQVQYFLIGAYLFETFQTDDLKGWKYLQDAHYQQGIGKSLRLCIENHIALKKFMKMSLDFVLIGIPFFLVFGVLLLISSFAFITNFADTMSNILKIRMLIFATSSVCITMVLCWTGQQLINLTSEIFLSLGGAPWYFWNRDNRKILLMFLTNCTKNESVVLAGICINYAFFLSLVRLTVTYTLVLYKLHRSGIV